MPKQVMKRSELKTPAVLAQEAKAKLEQMLNRGTEAEPAASDGKPRFPVV